MKNIKSVAFVLSALVVSAIVGCAVLAWTEPGSPAPGGNVAAPVNTGSAAQTKSGALTVAGNMRTNTGFCINSDCITSWANVTGPWTKSGNNIYSNNSGNVGVGTNNPAQKLDVVGSIRFGNGGGYLYSSVNDNLTLQTAANTPNPNLTIGYGKGSGAGIIDTAKEYFSMNAGKFMFNNGSVGIGTTAPEKALQVAGGIKGTEICIGSDCRTTWPGGIAAQACPGNQVMTGINSTGNIICKDFGGGGFVPEGGCRDALPAGNKKIFVTSYTYSQDAVSGSHNQPGNWMARADNACQERANAAGLTGTYRHLVFDTDYNSPYCSNTVILRRPYDVLPSAALWNGERIGTTTICKWHLVALNPSDMFTADGSGNYLESPIQFNERGQSSNVNVFTNFTPTGAGNYSSIETCYGSTICYYPPGCYYGNSVSRNANWAGVHPTSCDSSCNGNKALYCVEQ